MSVSRWYRSARPETQQISGLAALRHSGTHARRRGFGLLLVLLLLGAVLVFEQMQSVGETRAETQVKNDEMKLAQAEKQHDTAMFQRLLRDDLIYVAFNGWVFTKHDLVSKMHYIDVDRYEIQNVKARTPDSGTVLITYDLKAKAQLAGHKLPQRQYVSSLWVKNKGSWQLLFHQETPATHP